MRGAVATTVVAIVVVVAPQQLEGGDEHDQEAARAHDPVQLTNVFHPSNTTLTVAPANAAHHSTFGIDWGREGQSGFSAPFSWAG